MGAEHRSLDWTAEHISSFNDAQLAAYLARLQDADMARLNFHWPFWARPDQLEPPEPWATWLIMAGRGFGKTRTGSEWVRKIKDHHGRIALVGETAADVRDVMIEGESGIMAISPPWERPAYMPSRRELQWPNGAIAKTYSGEDPDQLRGPQHECAWVDELAKFQYAQDTWDNMKFGLRLGNWPRALVTTTPRPIPIIRQLIGTKDTVVTRGSTFANAANLAPQFIEEIRRKYEGTRLGRQELNAEILDDLPNALWTRAMIEKARYRGIVPQMQRVVVGVDPSGADEERGDSQGIIAAGVGVDGRAYILEDATVRLTPDGWARAVCNAYERHQADRIVAERNFGGEMVRSTIRMANPMLPVTLVTASRGKQQRAEPIAALYEQDRVRHVGTTPELEDQMCYMTTQGYEGDDSPDRLDALVWALTDLMLPKNVIGVIKGIRY